MDCSMPGLPCLSPTAGACSNSCPSSQWCHPTISSSVISFFSCLQSFPVSLITGQSRFPWIFVQWLSMKTPHSGRCPTSPVLHIPTYLAETCPSARVTDSRLGPISAAVAGQALREAVEAGSTPVTLPPCDPGLASVLKERKQKSSPSLYTRF